MLKVVQVVEVATKYRRIRIRVGPNHATVFGVVTDFKQRDVLSPTLKVVQVVEVASK